MWTCNRFEVEARVLAGIAGDESSSEQNVSHDGSKGDALDMSMWSIALNPSMPSSICLNYPPFVRRLRFTDDKTNQDDTGIFDFEDTVTSVIASEDEVAQIRPPASEKHEEPTTLSEWKFSIAYSYIYQVPVLYFQVQNLSGQYFSRSEVLASLSWCSEMSEGDSWDFMSEEEHPVSGQSYYYIHPCQTKNRMNLMIKSKDIIENDERSHMPFQTSAPRDGMMLLSWLSMVLPAVGYRVSTHQFYCALSRAIKEN